MAAKSAILKLKGRQQLKLKDKSFRKPCRGVVSCTKCTFFGVTAFFQCHNSVNVGLMTSQKPSLEVSNLPITTSALGRQKYNL